ncbi:MAG: DNA cytosine methyltransferase [Rhodospirillales bacterium]|jgi:DNA (cytosine-5)-methyltransferase 1
MVNNVDKHTLYELFVGGGMARAGLEKRWNCSFANDFDPKKGTSYSANWGAYELIVDDIRNIALEELPARADLA